MRPAFDPSLDSVHGLIDLLNRAEARTRTVTTRIGDQTRRAYDNYLYFGGPAMTTPTEVHYSVHRPIEQGITFRYAHMIPSLTMPRTVTGNGYVRVAIGIQADGKFEVFGTEYDSRQHSLTEDVPFVLCAEENRIPDGTGLAVRMIQAAWPPASIEESIVETFLGYVGAT